MGDTVRVGVSDWKSQPRGQAKLRISKCRMGLSQGEAGVGSGKVG